MWRASERFLTGPPPWPPRAGRAGRPARRAAREAVVDAARSSRAPTTRDPRLRMIIERFATYAGADPRRAPAALAVAGLCRARLRRVAPARRAVRARAGARRAGSRRSGASCGCSEGVERIWVGGGRARGVVTASGRVAADAVVTDVDDGRRREAARAGPPAREHSSPGSALMLGLRGQTPGLAHHRIDFPADYDAEFDDVFVQRRPVARSDALRQRARRRPSRGRRRGSCWSTRRAAPGRLGGGGSVLIDRLGVRERIVERVRPHARRPRARDGRGRRRDLRRGAARPARCAQPPGQPGAGRRRALARRRDRAPGRRAAARRARRATVAREIGRWSAQRVAPVPGPRRAVGREAREQLLAVPVLRARAADDLAVRRRAVGVGRRVARGRARARTSPGAATGHSPTPTEASTPGAASSSRAGRGDRAVEAASAAGTDGRAREDRDRPARGRPPARRRRAGRAPPQAPWQRSGAQPDRVDLPRRRASARRRVRSARNASSAASSSQTAKSAQRRRSADSVIVRPRPVPAAARTAGPACARSSGRSSPIREKPRRGAGAGG